MKQQDSISFEQALSNLQCVLVARRELASSGSELTKLTWLDFDIMDVLYDQGDKTPSRLSELLGTSRSSMSKHLKYLQEYGLLASEISVNDARSRTTSLTKAGQDVMNTIYKGQKAIALRASKALTPDEQENFARLAHKVATALDEDALHTI